MAKSNLSNLNNPVAQLFISQSAEASEPKTAQVPTETAEKTALAPAKKADRAIRLNLLLPIDNKIKLEKMVQREGYKSMNDYVNYLIAVAVADEPEPTAKERAPYIEQADSYKKMMETNRKKRAAKSK